MPSHPFNSFWNKKHNENESNFNDVCSRNNLSKTKYVAYLKNLDEYE